MFLMEPTEDDITRLKSLVTASNGKLAGSLDDTVELAVSFGRPLRDSGSILKFLELRSKHLKVVSVDDITNYIREADQLCKIPCQVHSRVGPLEGLTFSVVRSDNTISTIVQNLGMNLSCCTY